MDLRLLRYFVTVIEVGSISAASGVLHVAQPSLSRQLRQLETRLGADLFDRSGRSVRMTSFGEAFLDIARRLLEYSEAAQAIALHLARGGTPKLIMAAASATVIDLIAPFVASKSAAPQLIDVLQAAPDQIFDSVGNSVADIGITTRLPPPTFGWRHVGYTYPWAQASAESGLLAGKSSIRVEDLVKFPLIMMTPAHAIRRLFDRAVSKSGSAYQPVIETSSNYMAQAFAAAGGGVCVLSDHSRFGLHAARVISKQVDLNIDHYAVWKPGHYASDAIHALIDKFQHFMAQYE